MVPTIVVSTVATNFNTLKTLFQFIFIFTSYSFLNHELHELNEFSYAQQKIREICVIRGRLNLIAVTR